MEDDTCTKIFTYYIHTQRRRSIASQMRIQFRICSVVKPTPCSFTHSRRCGQSALDLETNYYPARQVLSYYPARSTNFCERGEPRNILVTCSRSLTIITPSTYRRSRFAFLFGRLPRATRSPMTQRPRRDLRSIINIDWGHPWNFRFHYCTVLEREKPNWSFSGDTVRVPYRQQAVVLTLSSVVFFFFRRFFSFHVLHFSRCRCLCSRVKNYRHPLLSV
jgi:hypothetical protein